jgi:hypothetical protein
VISRVGVNRPTECPLLVSPNTSTEECVFSKPLKAGLSEKRLILASWTERYRIRIDRPISPPMSRPAEAESAELGSVDQFALSNYRGFEEQRSRQFSRAGSQCDTSNVDPLASSVALLLPSPSLSHSLLIDQNLDFGTNF